MRTAEELERELVDEVIPNAHVPVDADVVGFIRRIQRDAWEAGAEAGVHHVDVRTACGALHLDPLPKFPGDEQ